MLSHLFAFVLGVLFCKYLKPIRQKVFAFMFRKNVLPEEFESFKGKTFDDIKDIKSHFPEMRERNSIRILEIGVGSGTNFQYYPNGCHLTVVDPNPSFRSYYNENRSKYPQIQSEEIIVCGGEEMHMVPDNSVDVVLVTWVLCSVEDIHKVLEQIIRVLAPGGRFYFFEHVKEFDPKKYGSRSRKQEFFTRAQIWPAVFDGCEVNRDTLAALKKAGFSSMDCKLCYAPCMDSFIFEVLTPHLVGYATK